jgi:hypothetical protein
MLHGERPLKYYARFYRPLLDPSAAELARIALDKLESPYRFTSKKTDLEMTLVSAVNDNHSNSIRSIGAHIRDITEREGFEELKADTEIQLKVARFSGRDGGSLVVAKPFVRAGYTRLYRDREIIFGYRCDADAIGRTVTPHVTIGDLPGEIGINTDQDTQPIACLFGGACVQVTDVEKNELYKGTIADFDA